MSSLNTVWLVTSGDGSDGDEWGVDSIHTTEGSAFAAKAKFEAPKTRSDGSIYNFDATIEEWAINSDGSRKGESLEIESDP